MILQALKNIYPKASGKVLKVGMKDLEKCRGKSMSTEERRARRLYKEARNSTYHRRNIKNNRGRFKTESSR